MTVVAAHTWATNGHMIADVAKLGYLDGRVLDATYGEGNFWTEWRPEQLFTNDLYKPAYYGLDYQSLNRWFTDDFDSVVFDPPYKFQGTPTPGDEMDERYGTGVAARWQDRMEDITEGALNCYGACRRYLLVKCMDQVVSGAVRWQTYEITKLIEEAGGRLVDRFDYLTKGGRPQPSGRRQVHARRNYSTLLVFEKGRG